MINPLPQKSWRVSGGAECFLETSTGLAHELFGSYDPRWEMEFCERAGMLRVLEIAKPEVSIEIGTSNGGSLSAIAQHSTKVFTLDLDPRAKEKVATEYPHVEYVTGDSRVTLPALLSRMQKEKTALGFVLVDGAHDPDGVRADLNALLAYEPVSPLWIVMHDSFNPACREGIRTAAWSACPYLHMVEIDYVPGILHTSPELKRQMWGGLAVALMLPTKAATPPVIQSRQQALFELVERGSAHSWTLRKRAMLGRFARSLKARITAS